MQSFLARFAAVGIVAGGFLVTGDLGRLADRGRRLLDATTAPGTDPAAHRPPLDKPAAGPTAARTTPATPSGPWRRTRWR